MDKQAFIVQFPHPGGEHRPRGPEMAWNQDDHRRKFMLSQGSFVDDTNLQHEGDIVFWGEWEPPSRVVQQWDKEDDLPSFLHEPYFEKPSAAGSRQNTDPWVFGDQFLYSNCRQRTNKAKSETAMQRLTPGSVILFGSNVAGRFVLDTLFVVGERVGEFTPSVSDEIDVDPIFRIATIESLVTGVPEKDNASFTLYRGATIEQPFAGMFSFVPCLPSDGHGPRFARPAIEIPRIVNSALKMGFRGTGEPRAVADIADIWHKVKRQVFNQDLALATEISMPRTRVK